MTRSASRAVSAQAQAAAPVPAAVVPVFPSDADLVSAMAAGQRDALAELYDRYAPALLAMAQRLLRSASDAEDLLHDFFIEVWQNAHSYKVERGSVHSWLVVRLRSRAFDRLKSAVYTRTTSLQASGVELESVASPGESLPPIAPPGIARALATLAPDEQLLLALAYLEGRTLSEVASQLALPVGTVKSRLRRLLERLRRDFERRKRRGGP